MGGFVTPRLLEKIYFLPLSYTLNNHHLIKVPRWVPRECCSAEKLGTHSTLGTGREQFSSAGKIRIFSLSSIPKAPKAEAAAKAEQESKLWAHSACLSSRGSQRVDNCVYT